MRVDCRDRRRAVVSGADVHQSKDASMGKASDDCQFAEVLVKRDHGLLMFPWWYSRIAKVSGILDPSRRPTRLRGRREQGRFR